MPPIFLDTGYIIALETADDQHHEAALAHWQDLSVSLPLLVTTSYIFDEVVTFFNSRSRHTKAVEVGNRLLRSSLIHLVQVDEILFYTGWDYFQQHQDKQYSLTDCISFVVMQEREISVALTFDKHFTQAGFQKEPC
jgi:predicted nucleic acid-binding protein